MKRAFMAMSFAVLLLAACSGGDNLSKLNGKWVVDGEASMKLMGVTPTNDLERALVAKMFEAINMEIDAANKKLKISFGPESKEGGFTVVSDSGKTITLKSSEDDEKITFEIVNDGSIIMRNEREKDKAMAFKRGK